MGVFSPNRPLCDLNDVKRSQTTPNDLERFFLGWHDADRLFSETTSHNPKNYDFDRDTVGKFDFFASGNSKKIVEPFEMSQKGL